MSTNKLDLVLLAESVKWQYKLDQYTDEHMETLMGILGQSQKELGKILDSASPSDWKKKRTFALLEDVQDMMLGTKAQLTGSIEDAAATAGSTAYDAYSKILSFGGAASNVTAVAMTPAQVKAIVQTVPVGGKLLEGWVDKTFDSNLKGKIKREVAAGLISGDSYGDIAKRIKTAWPGLNREIETLAKTYVQSVNSQAMQDVYEENKDVISMVQWRAAMSNRTCLRCAGLDGQKYKIDNHPSLPLHPRCRCVLIPITDADSLGLTNKMVQKAARPYKIENKKIKGIKGKVIDAGTWAGDYDSFIKSMTQTQQKDFLGPKRLEMINKGEVTFNDLVDKKTGRIRTLEELPGYKAGIKEVTTKAMATKAAKTADKAALSALNANIKDSAAGTAAAIEKAAVERAAKEALVKATKEAAEKAVKEAVEKAAKIAAEKAALADLKEEYIQAMLAGESATAEATDAWIFNATKEEVHYLKAKQTKQLSDEFHAKLGPKAVKALDDYDMGVINADEYNATIDELKNPKVVTQAEIKKQKDKYYKKVLAGKEATIEEAEAWIAHATPKEKSWLNKKLVEQATGKSGVDNIAVKAAKDPDALWKDKGKPENFTFLKQANVGGVHEKEFYINQAGEKYLFKPLSKFDEFIAHGEEAVYKIGRLINPDAVEARVIELNGRVGSIQKWKTDLKDDIDFKNIKPAKLTASELEQIQQEHVLDWLTSNHDSHSQNFLRGNDGKVYGIDKGQAFKKLGYDDLSIFYSPNKGYGFEGPYYNDIFSQVKKGSLTFDPQAALKAINKIEAINDIDYLNILKPYAKGRFKGDTVKETAFFKAALKRKNGLKADFENFYGDVLGEPGFKFKDAKAAVKKTVPTPKQKALNIQSESLYEAKKLFDSGKIDHDTYQEALKLKAAKVKNDYDSGKLTIGGYKDAVAYIKDEAEDALQSAKTKAPKVAAKAGAKSSAANPGKVGSRFKDKKHVELYYQEKEKYAKFFESGTRNKGWDKDKTRQKIKDEMPEVWSIMNSWQGSTNQRGPMDMRAMHLLLEGDGKQKFPFIPDRFEYTGKQLMDDCRSWISEEAYIKVRAFNQAYMEKKGLKSIELMRGTDGQEGRIIANTIKDTKPKDFNYEDRELSGYTTSTATAEKFGTSDYGFEVRLNFNRDEILIHTDLLTGVTDSYASEREYICISRKRKVPIKDVRIRTKKFGEEF